MILSQHTDWVHCNGQIKCSCTVIVFIYVITFVDKQNRKGFKLMTSVWKQKFTDVMLIAMVFFGFDVIAPLVIIPMAIMQEDILKKKLEKYNLYKSIKMQSRAERDDDNFNLQYTCCLYKVRLVSSRDTTLCTQKFSVIVPVYFSIGF